MLEHVRFGMPRRHQRGDAEQVVGHFNLGLRRGPAQRCDNNDKYVYGPCSVPGIALDTLHTRTHFILQWLLSSVFQMKKLKHRKVKHPGRDHQLASDSTKV